MSKKTYFWQKNYSQHVGATLLAICSFLGFVLVTVGTPLGVLKSRSDNSCFTLWGGHDECSSPDYDFRFDRDEECSDVKTRIAAAEAFSILAIFGSLITFGVAWAQLSDMPAYTASALMALFTVGSSTVPWAVVTSMYYTRYCDDDTYTNTYMKLGPGYGVLVAGFCVLTVGLLLFLVFEKNGSDEKDIPDEDDHHSNKNSSEREPSS